MTIEISNSNRIRGVCYEYVHIFCEKGDCVDTGASVHAKSHIRGLFVFEREHELVYIMLLHQ